MDRCPTCGAAVRPGAKFCTSCGSRLSEHVSGKSSESTWGSPPSDTQETEVATPAVADEHAAEETIATPAPNWGQAVEDAPDDDAGETTETSTDTDWPTTETATEADEDKEEIPANEGTSWSSNWPGSESGTTATGADSPASRFESGLDEDAAESEEPAPARSTWSWRSPAKDTESSATETDAAGFSTEGQVDTLSGDESVSGDVAVASTSAGATSVEGTGQDARQRASDLTDELRGLIWSIGVEESAGDGQKNTIQNMSRVRGETGNFSDLASVIEAVRENPRDIDALRDLGDKAGRLQELLDSHGKLATALDDVIRDLR